MGFVSSANARATLLRTVRQIWARIHGTQHYTLFLSGGLQQQVLIVEAEIRKR